MGDVPGAALASERAGLAGRVVELRLQLEDQVVEGPGLAGVVGHGEVGVGVVVQVNGEPSEGDAVAADGDPGDADAAVVAGRGRHRRPPPPNCVSTQ